ASMKAKDRSCRWTSAATRSPWSRGSPARARPATRATLSHCPATATPSPTPTASPGSAATDFLALRAQQVPVAPLVLDPVAGGAAGTGVGAVAIQRMAVVADLAGAVGPCHHADHAGLQAGAVAWHRVLDQQRRPGVEAFVGAAAAVTVAFEEVERGAGAVDQERAVDPFRGAHGQRVGRRAGLVTGDIAIGRHVGRARHDVVVGG